MKTCRPVRLEVPATHCETKELTHAQRNQTRNQTSQGGIGGWLPTRVRHLHYLAESDPELITTSTHRFWLV
jgi:hypothetical protein